MQSILTEDNQAIIDVAIQQYGNSDADIEIVELNGLGHDGELELDAPILAGQTILYDENSPLRKDLSLKALDGKKVTTCEMPILTPEAENFYRAATRQNGKLLWRDVLAIDKLTRDLSGEYNPLYPTYDLTNNLIAVWPMAGATNRIKSIDLGGYFPLSPLPPVGVIDYLADTNYFRVNTNGTPDGCFRIPHLVIDQDVIFNDQVACGVVLTGGNGRNLFGAVDGSGNKGLFLRYDGGQYQYTSVGVNNGLASASRPLTPGLIYGESFGGRMKLFHENDLLSMVNLPPHAYEPFAETYLGGINGEVQSNSNDIAFAFCARSLNGNDRFRIALLNAINYYLYSRGVYKTFTAYSE